MLASPTTSLFCSPRNPRFGSPEQKRMHKGKHEGMQPFATEPSIRRFPQRPPSESVLPDFSP